MKTHSIKAVFPILVLLAANSIIFFTSSCSKDNNEDQNAGISTYTGTVKMEQGSNSYDDHLDLSFTAGSTKNGTFFRKSDGAVGQFTGSESNGTLTITGSMKGNTSLTFSGTVKISNSTLDIDLTFNDIGNSYTCKGTLSKVDCIDISGNYYIYESYKLAVTADGETDTLENSGYGSLSLEQIKCHVSYTVTNTDVTREGDIDGNKFSISGVCMVPSDEITYTQNSFTAEVTIIDNNHFEYDGIMKAKGTYQGHSFTIKGSSSGTFDRTSKSHSLTSSGNSSWLQTMPAFTHVSNSQGLFGDKLNRFFNKMPTDFIFGISSCK
jgi:hypothetical protein